MFVLPALPVCRFYEEITAEIILGAIANLLCDCVGARIALGAVTVAPHIPVTAIPKTLTHIPVTAIPNQPLLIYR